MTVGGREGVSWPHRVGAVPRLAVRRQKRPADDLLAAAVAAGGTAVVCQVLAGMGGVGKTQLAAGLVERLWQARKLDLLVWVSVGSRDGVLSAYAQAAAEVTGLEDRNPQQAAERLLAWLASTGRRWLVVLDDVADPQDMAGLWPPDTRSGRTIVTSRRRDAALVDGRQLVDVGVFTALEAVDYLRTRLGEQPHRLDEADRLAADLGYLPLALAQAAAYLRDLDLTCAGYRRRLHARRLDRLHPAVLPDGQQRAVADTWGLSIDAADRQTGGLAAIVLKMAALLDPNGIPIRLFTTDAALGYWRRQLRREVDADDVHDTIRALYRLGLAETTADPDLDDQLLRVHALVQRVVRENTDEPVHAPLARAAADALIQAWPETERDTATSRLAQLLRANATNLTAVTADHLWCTADGTPAAHSVLFRAGKSLGEIGLADAARDHYQQLHTTSLRVLGPDHRDTLIIGSDRAGWQGVAGDPAGAAAAYERLLTDRLRVLGPDHPDILTTRGQLARWQGAAGDPAGAAAVSEQLLTDLLRVLSPDHPNTLAARHSLAYWRGAAGIRPGPPPPPDSCSPTGCGYSAQTTRTL
ncbi:NB-ARC domain-containing protein [Paractinoplanes durhamensis]|uniref:NB-ARC domain-containing protein n=1 Tax=Paractinoplanes durhamensis TaxID=113563 RepID=UPI00363B848B